MDPGPISLTRFYWAALAVLSSWSAALPAPPAPPAQGRDPGILFSWGTINVALAPDSTDGLRLLSATTPRAGPAVVQQSFEADFIPDSASRWALAAESLLAHPPDTGVAATHPLIGRWGSGILMALRRERAGGEVERYLLLFRARGTDPFRITLTSDAAGEFARGMRDEAAQAGWSPKPPPVDSTARVTTSAGAPAVRRTPRFLRGPMLTYPEGLRLQGITGVVWAQFIVDSTGRPEVSTLRVLYSNSPDFSMAVRRWAEAAQFEPASIDGHPRAALVELPFTFTLR